MDREFLYTPGIPTLSYWTIIVDQMSSRRALLDHIKCPITPFWGSRPCPDPLQPPCCHSERYRRRAIDVDLLVDASHVFAECHSVTMPSAWTLHHHCWFAFLASRLLLTRHLPSSQRCEPPVSCRRRHQQFCTDDQFTRDTFDPFTIMVYI